MTDRIALSSIRSLTLYKEAHTTGRRTSPVPQLICEGTPCKLYTPDVVRCTNAGGHGSEIDWTCDAELPSSLRMGRVEVSCEGYSRAGDPYVLKGSCGLTYRLVRIPTGDDSHSFPHLAKTSDPVSVVFGFVFVVVFLFILIGFLKSYFGSQPNSGSGGRPGSDNHRGGGGGRNLHGWPPAPSDDPPPYPGNPPSKPNTEEPWRPGFWTGAAAGGIGAYLLHQRNTAATAPNARSSAEYDWEREREARGESSSPFARRTGRWRDVDRGEGSSSGLGEMRTSTGYGGSSVR